MSAPRAHRAGRKSVERDADRGLQRTVHRVIAIIERLAATDSPLSVRELSVELSLPKSAAHRILSALRSEGLVFLDDASGNYKISAGIYRLITLLQARLDLRAQATPELRRLRDLSTETVGLMVREGYERVCLETLEGTGPVRGFLQRGERQPLYFGSGKVLLAGMDDEEFERYLGSVRLVPYTEHTFATVESLRSEIARVRHRGYATSFEERNRGLAAVAAPVVDYSGRVAAAVVLAGARQSIEAAGVEALSAMVKDAARRTSERLMAEPTTARSPTTDGTVRT